MQGVLTPTIELWNFRSHGGLPSPHFGSVSFILTLSQSRVVTMTNQSAHFINDVIRYLTNHFILKHMNFIVYYP